MPGPRPPPALLTLQEVLERLNGRAGRTKVLQHLKAMRPDGAARRRILLREKDCQDLEESLSMSVKLTNRNGTWYLRGTVRGVSIYESTGTHDKKAAEQIRIKRESDLLNASIFGKQAIATFPDAAASYLETAARSNETKRKVARLLRHFGGIRLAEIDQVAIDNACKEMLRPGTGPAGKLGAIISPMNAILEHAAKRRMCQRPNFEKPKVPPPTTAFLYPAQATALVSAASLHLRPLLVFLLAVGCRPCEALSLDWSNVDLPGAQATLHLGKVGGRELVVTLLPVVTLALSALPHDKGRVFRTWLPGEGGRKDDFLGPAYSDDARMDSGWAGACARAGLPGAWKERVGRNGDHRKGFDPEHTPYSARHTCATWHYCVHKDLQKLRDEVGWTTTRMAERYGKRMSEAHREAVIEWWDGKAQPGLDAVAACKIRAGSGQGRPDRG